MSSKQMPSEAIPADAIAFANEKVSSGEDLTEVARRLRTDFGLGKVSTVKAIQAAGIRLAEAKAALDRSLSPEELEEINVKWDEFATFVETMNKEAESTPDGSTTDSNK